MNEIVFNVYVFDRYLITYNTLLKTETFDNEWYYGIIFYINDERYELIHNHSIGNRIIINNKDGWNDIPFKPETFHFLPSEVKAQEL